jgi:hypothetical protein
MTAYFMAALADEGAPAGTCPGPARHDQDHVRRGLVEALSKREKLTWVIASIARRGSRGDARDAYGENGMIKVSDVTGQVDALRRCRDPVFG